METNFYNMDISNFYKLDISFHLNIPGIILFYKQLMFRALLS